MGFIKSNRLLASATGLLVSSVAFSQTAGSHSYRFEGNPDGITIQNEKGNLIVNYSLNELHTGSVSTPEGTFFRVSIPGHGRTSEPGKPEMPVFSRLIAIPDDSEPDILISEVRTRRIKPLRENVRGLLYPRQPDAAKNQDKLKTGFLVDKSIYSKRGIIESDTVRIERLGKVRGLQLAGIYISPARYNPYSNELEIITSMKIEVIFRGSKTALWTSENFYPATSGGLPGKGILNYDSGDLIPGYSDRPVRMIILTDTAFRKGLKPFIEWKTRKGISVSSLYKGAAYAGTTFTQMKDTLRKIFNSATEDNPPPEYLLIVGDVNRIPKSEGTSQVSDLYYGEFDGNGDYLPDMYIGRLPVADTAELRAVVRKLVQYESFAFADTNLFYRRSLVTAGNDAGYSVFMNGQLKYATDNYLKASNDIESHAFFYPQSVTAEDTIKKLINRGVSFINYSGHGDVSGWLDPVIKVPEVALFKNRNMYPFVISNACLTARYSTSASFGNRMVVSADKGAIGFIGCSNDSYWEEDFHWSVGVGTVSENPEYSETGLGAYDRLFHLNNEKPSDWHITMGQINYAGNLAVSASSSARKKYYWETYTLLGDPSIIPYIGKPDTFLIQLPDTLPNGLRSLPLTIDPFAYVAVSHWDTLWDASHASPSGSVMLDLPGLSNDSCLIVITGQNMVPLIKTIYFADSGKEYINLTSTAINDSGTNNNGKADYGETFYLKTTIGNLGLSEATGLSATLSTSSDWVTVIDGYKYIGNLEGKTEIVLLQDFRIKIDELIPDKGFVTLDLKLRDNRTEKNYKIDIRLHAPVLQTLNCIIDDSDMGNGDLIADPGETADLVFSVTNTGSSPSSGLFRINSGSPSVTLHQTEIPTGILEPGMTRPLIIQATLSPQAIKGSSFIVETILDCDPYQVAKDFSIAVGKIRESFEYQSFKIFPWKVTQTNPWTITSNQSYEGLFSARSAVISHNSESVLRINVNMPVKDTLRFMYKVSSEINYDYLELKLNGKQEMKVSGEVGWKEKKVELREGINLLEWIYKKDESVSSGNDNAMIDYITFPAAGFSSVDLKTGKIVTPVPGKDLAQETVTAEVISFSTDTIKSFNMAYSINDITVVTEKFTKTIFPGDTAVIGFRIPADLEGEGTYLVKVYGFNNNDGYLNNDTSKLIVYNTSITPVENPDNLLRIMPNPFTGSFRMEFNSDQADEITISIYDHAGRILHQERSAVIPGMNIFTLTPDNIPPGFYTLKVKGKHIFKAARIIRK